MGHSHSQIGASKIPLFKVFMSPEAPDLVTKTLMSGYVGQGPRVDEFEIELGRVMGIDPPPLTVSTCTHGLDLAYHMIGIGAGDEVISSAATCTATNCPLATRKARIVWADVDPITGLIDPLDVKRKMTARTKAIIAVDWAGRLCDYDALCDLGVPVVQDAAHSFLADRPGRKHGDYAVWSFQAIKHLTTCDGGAILPPADQRKRAELLRWYGFNRKTSVSFRCSQVLEEAGFKHHMNDVAASIGLANIKHVEDVVRRHRENAAFYEAELSNISGVITPPPDPGCSWWLYCLIMKDENARDAFIPFMAERGIECSVVHARNDKHPAFRYWGGDLPGLEYFSSREVAIPVGWWLADDDRNRIVAAVKEWLRR